MVGADTDLKSICCVSGLLCCRQIYSSIADQRVKRELRSPAFYTSPMSDAIFKESVEPL